MPENIENFAVVNRCKYVYLRAISEPKDNSLRIVIEEAVVDESRMNLGDDITQIRTDLVTSYRSIEPDESCELFELYWKHYVAYLVTEEGVGSCGKYDDETYTGKLLRKYKNSHFLDHLARDTGGHFKPIQHFKLICLNHLIDVASEDPPDIRVIDHNGSV